MTNENNPGTEKPEMRRRHKWTLSLQCDEHSDLICTLNSLLFEAQSRGGFPSGVSGGPGAGYTIEYNEDPEWSHDRYFEVLDAYLERKRAPQ